MRRAARVDDNQAEIVKELRARGFSVQTGHDDILVGYWGMTFWYEIKNINGKNRKQESQEKLESTWRGHYLVVYSLQGILEDIDKHVKAKLEAAPNGVPDTPRRAT